MDLAAIFGSAKPIIGCIHLLPLPGSPGYNGNMSAIYAAALSEAEIYQKNRLHGIIIENFRDNPFYPEQLPPETIAAMAAVTRDVRKVFKLPIGVNALRNDAAAALAVAVAAEADFIRVNIHTSASVTDQGIIQGKAHETLRMRKYLGSKVLIFADVHVKHAKPLVERDIELEVRELAERGLADGIIVSGTYTGGETNPKDVDMVKQITAKPVFIGSGTKPDNLEYLYPVADGFIVGSCFKESGQAGNRVDPERVKRFMERYRAIGVCP